MKSLRGFTLLEMIVSMVIVSILTLGLMNFGILSSELYVESKHRISALEEARFVMARFNRELVNALPSSPRLVGDQQECLEYIPLLAVAEYDPDSFTLGGNSSNLTLLTPLNDEVSTVCRQWSLLVELQYFQVLLMTCMEMRLTDFKLIKFLYKRVTVTPSY